jgi:hypothetical protein
MIGILEQLPGRYLLTRQQTIQISGLQQKLAILLKINFLEGL